MPGRIDVAIDTSSLSNILNSEVLLKQFKADVLAKSYRLVVSGHVIDEIVSGTRSDKIMARAKKLAILWKELGDSQFTVAKSSYQIIKEELQRRPGSTPTLSSGMRKVILSNLERYDPTDPNFFEVTEEVRKASEKKDSALKTDKEVGVAVEKRLILDSPKSIADTENAIRGYTGPTEDYSWFLEATLKIGGPYDFRLIVPMSAICKEPRYHSTKIYLSLSQLTMLGAALDGSSLDEVACLFGAKRNNWCDNAITAVAGYSKYYINDDSGARDKAKFLVKRGLANFLPITLDEFLNLDQL